MDKDLLIVNIKKYCALRGEPPTLALQNSGVGKNLIANMLKGQTPSVAKVADLAAYLGVTTSDLVGDAKKPADQEADELQRAIRFFIENLPEDQRRQLLEPLQGQKQP